MENNTQSNTFRNKIKQLFLFEGKKDFVLMTIFFMINGLVLVNSFLHHPKIGYDAVNHLTYLQVLSDRLPEREDTPEFFSPPLPYIFPAIFDKVCETVQPGETILPMYQGSTISFDCRTYDGKFAQLLNFILSLGATILILVIAEQIKPGSRYFKISSLLLLSLLTVYYKTFSQVRGEPYVVFFVLLSIFLMNKFFTSTLPRMKLGIALGISLGLLLLSRQWGFFILIAIGLFLCWVFLQNRHTGLSYARVIFPVLLIAMLVGGWFFISLYIRYGTFTAFNVEPQEFSVSNVPDSFFRVTRLKNFELFQEPVRPSFSNEFFPTFYSDIWGDYWGFFVYIKTKSSFGDVGLGNYNQVVPYLGRVNLFATIPTIILLAGMFFGLLNLFKLKSPLTPERMSLGLLTLIVVVSFLGFMWFVISYYTVDDSTLKATYIIQAFIAMIFLGADVLERIRQRQQFIYNIMIVLLFIVFLHNMPAMITHYNMFLIH